MRTPRPAPGQLDLFASPTPPTAEPSPLQARFAGLAPIAARLPPFIRFGTSSWSFPGWAGIVYEPGRSEAALARDGLRDYVRHPLLRTVGIDRGYYAALQRDDLERYAAQLPAGFPCCSKVPSYYTTPIHLGRGSGPRGAPNPAFLDATRFGDEVVQPALSVFADHLGPLILEFPALPRAYRLDPGPFLDRLEAFLESLPAGLPVAVELRDQRLLSTDYCALLARRRVAHVYNYWSDMPMPAEQAAVVPIASMPFFVARLMLRPGTRYEQRKRSFAPFDRLLDPDDTMRAQLVSMLGTCADLGRSAFVLVNNKAEGSAPLTIEAIASSLAAR